MIRHVSSPPTQITHRYIVHITRQSVRKDIIIKCISFKCLVGYKIFEAYALYDDVLADALSRNMDDISVCNLSWGTADMPYHLASYSLEQMNSLKDSSLNGRGGLGSIHVKAVGNGG